MSNVKIFYKIQTIFFLAIFVSLIVCFTTGSVFADTELPVLDLEHCDKRIEERDLAGYAGVITNLDCVKRNKDVFARYIDSAAGNVLLPNRDNADNVLAYQLVGFCETGIAVYPIYAYNQVDKACVDYRQLVTDETVRMSDRDKDTILAATATDDRYHDYMSVDISFCVFSRKPINNYVNIGAVRIKMTVDYFPSDNPNYNEYGGRYEVYVSPSAKTTLRSFLMTPVVCDEIRVDTDNACTNHNAPITTSSFTYSTGITAQTGMQIGLTDASISVGQTRNISMAFGYSISVPQGASSVVQSAVLKRIDNFYGFPIQVTRSGRSNSMWSSDLKNDRGITYSGLYYATHRIRRDVGAGCLGLHFSNLSLWGQSGEPSYDEENTEIVSLIAKWNNNFDNKTFVVVAGSPDGDQYFENYEAHSSLPKEGTEAGILIFSEE